jgi:hypothetical protein
MNSNSWKISARVLWAGILFGAIVPADRGATFTFSNTNSIAVSDSTNALTLASPYPSTNVVTGFNGLVVTKITVTLRGFSHTFPSDVSILLAGPQGQSAIIMSETGGQDKYSVTNLTLTLDDAATNSLPVYSSLVSGVFKPTDGYLALGGYPRLPYSFPSPAPLGNSNAVADLSVFNGTDPTGIWNLFVLCDAAGTDSGSISNGWSLNLSLAVPLQIARSQTNVVLAWPASATNCTLQFSPTPAGTGAWSNISTMPVLSAGRLSVTNPIGKGAVFYRLVTN